MFISVARVAPEKSAIHRPAMFLQWIKFERETQMKFCIKCNSQTDRSPCGKCKVCASNYYQKNKEKQKKYQSEYWLNNSERILETKRKYRAKNKDKKRIYRQNRRCRESGGKNKLPSSLIEKLISLQKGRCACGCNELLANDFHVDHIMPLALGGLNVPTNIQLLKKRCNLRKSFKHPVVFMQENGFLL